VPDDAERQEHAEDEEAEPPFCETSAYRHRVLR
jgi:hypothetical protein